MIVPKDQNVLTPTEVAALTGYHLETVRDALRQGDLPAIRQRRRWYIKREDALAWAGPHVERVSA